MPKINVRYFIASDREAYWTVETPDDESVAYCANRYATFHGDTIGRRQINGWASTPLNAFDAKGRRAWFERFARPFATRCHQPIDGISVRAVESLSDLGVEA